MCSFVGLLRRVCVLHNVSMTTVLPPLVGPMIIVECLVIITSYSCTTLSTYEIERLTYLLSVTYICIYIFIISYIYIYIFGAVY